MFQNSYHKLKAVLITGVIFLYINAPVLGQAKDHFIARTYNSSGNTLPYRILFPDSFDPEQKYPLILFLHGAGERGDDNARQLVHGGDFFAADSNRRNFPAVIVFPQCQENTYWANVKIHYQQDGSRSFSFDPSGEPTIPMQLTISLLDSLLGEAWVDQSRVYIGGLSMGGMGTFEMLYRMPQIFAAAFPVCGGSNPEMINEAVNKVQVWAFHGTDDGVVKPELSEKMIEAYIKAGAHAWLTLYPGVGHNAWDYVFQDPDLLPWLFSVQKH